MKDDRKYVRIYYNDLIRDYPGVWSDDAQLATWVRLLATSDPMWPTPPELPRSVKPRVLNLLTDSTLVERLPDHRYRIKGIDAERNRRSDAGRNAAAVRWHADGNAEGNAEVMPNPNPNPKQDETKPMGADASDRDSLDTYHELTLYRPWGVFSGDKLKVAIDDYGDADVDAALREEATINADRKTLLDRTLARLARNADRKRDQRKTKPRIVKPTDEERSQALRNVRAEAKLA